LQSVVKVTVPEAELEFETTQPDAVCRVMESVVWSFTPSIISISPPAGQLGPNIQNAGQVPQIPPGMCAMSAIKSPWAVRRNQQLCLLRINWRDGPTICLVAA
jgi:hypothetical protein